MSVCQPCWFSVLSFSWSLSSDNIIGPGQHTALLQPGRDRTENHQDLRPVVSRPLQHCKSEQWLLVYRPTSFLLLFFPSPCSDLLTHHCFLCSVDTMFPFCLPGIWFFSSSFQCRLLHPADSVSWFESQSDFCCLPGCCFSTSQFFYLQ